MSIKSYYSAFQEFRKMLEGVLWIKHIILSPHDIPQKITEFKYSEKLKEINPKFAKLYKKLNYLMHYKEEKTPIFNINKIYKPCDWLYKLLYDINEIADDYINYINKLINNIDCNLVMRYCKLLELLTHARKSYNLKNYKITNSNLIVLPINLQKIFCEMIIADKKNIYEIKKFSSQYIIGLKEHIHTPRVLRHYNHNLEQNFNYLSKYDNQFLKYISTLNKNTSNSYHINLNWYKSIEKEARIKLMNKTFNLAYQTMQIISEKEINDSGNSKLAILKSLLEDLLINESCSKSINLSGM